MWLDGNVRRFDNGSVQTLAADPQQVARIVGKPASQLVQRKRAARSLRTLRRPSPFCIGVAVGKWRITSRPPEASSSATRLRDGLVVLPWAHATVGFLSTIASMRALAVNHRLERALLAHYPLTNRQESLSLLDRIHAYVMRIDQTIIDIVREANDHVDLDTTWRPVCERMNKQLEFRGLLTVDGHLREMTAAGLLERVGPDRYAWLGGSSVAQFGAAA